MTLQPIVEYGLFTQCNSLSDKYEFGYNGQMKLNELAGIGNHYQYKFREDDPRIGRFWSIDPLRTKYPNLSVYQFAGNTPVWARELEGLEAWYTAGTYGESGSEAMKPVTWGPLSQKVINILGLKGAPTYNVPNVTVNSTKTKSSGWGLNFKLRGAVKGGTEYADLSADLQKSVALGYTQGKVNTYLEADIDVTQPFSLAPGATRNDGSGTYPGDGTTSTNDKLAVKMGPLQFSSEEVTETKEGALTAHYLKQSHSIGGVIGSYTVSHYTDFLNHRIFTVTQKQIGLNIEGSAGLLLGGEAELRFGVIKRDTIFGK